MIEVDLRGGELAEHEHMQIRVAYLVNQYPKVSHSFIRREIRALERNGVIITRIALRGWDAELVDAEDAEERERTRYVLRNGISTLLVQSIRTSIASPIVFLKALRSAWRMSRGSERRLAYHLAYLAEACVIAQWVRASNIRHLHAHFGTNSAEIAMMVHILTDLPWSFTVHGPEEFEKSHAIGLTEKLASCSFVVAISAYGRSQLQRWMDPAEWRRIHVVHCGLESAFHSSTTALAPTDRRLVCVGRLCREKGQLLLLEAARRLKDRRIEFELVLAGDGEIRREVDELIRRFGLQENVRVTGWVDSQSVRAEILAARALVLPSSAEGLPVVIMEAMALQRPVISTFVAGIPELVRTGIDGWLIPAGDVDELVSAMIDCLDAECDTLHRMGRAARARALERHDVDREAEKLVRYFSQ